MGPRSQRSKVTEPVPGPTPFLLVGPVSPAGSLRRGWGAVRSEMDCGQSSRNGLSRLWRRGLFLALPQAVTQTDALGPLTSTYINIHAALPKPPPRPH